MLWMMLGLDMLLYIVYDGCGSARSISMSCEKFFCVRGERFCLFFGLRFCVGVCFGLGLKLV
jgi:hypothetical protein